MEKRLKVIGEIKDTEISFFEHIFTLTTLFIHPALKEGICPPTLETLLQKLPFEEITTFSKLLISEIQKLSAENAFAKESIGKLFYEKTTEDVVAAFSRYSSLYTEISECILASRKSNNQKDRAFIDFLRKAETSPLTSLNFQSLLITGVQRVPRYSLLLEVK